MLHENPEHLFHIEYYDHQARPDDIVLHYDGGRFMMIGGALPRFAQMVWAIPQARYLFEMGGERYFWVESIFDYMIDDAEWREIGSFRQIADQHMGFAAVTGAQLCRFYQDNIYCGHCGTKREHSDKERAMVCPECKRIIYPKISPVIIVGITNGNRLLLTKYANRPNANYALVAGFCECGESLEATIAREAMEEVGLKVKNFRYYTSQPWSFSDTLLMGFYCDVDGDPTPHADGEELAEATWFERDEIPMPESTRAMTARMIEAFKLGEV